MRFCSFEGREFADEDFEFTTEHGWIHNVQPPHTIAGELTSLPGSLPGTFKLMPGDDAGERPLT